MCGKTKDFLLFRQSYTGDNILSKILCKTLLDVPDELPLYVK